MAGNSAGSRGQPICSGSAKAAALTPTVAIFRNFDHHCERRDERVPDQSAAGDVRLYAHRDTQTTLDLRAMG